MKYQEMVMEMHGKFMENSWKTNGNVMENSWKTNSKVCGNPNMSVFSVSIQMRHLD